VHGSGGHKGVYFFFTLANLAQKIAAVGATRPSAAAALQVFVLEAN
jgi:hypothetical protein